MDHLFSRWTQGTGDGGAAGVGLDPVDGWETHRSNGTVDGLETHRWNGTKSAFADCASIDVRFRKSSLRARPKAAAADARETLSQRADRG